MSNFSRITCLSLIILLWAYNIILDYMNRFCNSSTDKIEKTPFPKQSNSFAKRYNSGKLLDNVIFPVILVFT